MFHKIADEDRIDDDDEYTLGCFSKDTLKKNKKTNPVRSWGGPRENISRRRG